VDRREFVYGLGAAAASLRPSAFSLERSARISRIGVQLYTVRDRMRADFEGTLAQVAAIGFKEVEFAGYFTRTPGQVRDVLRRHHLSAPATHIGIEPLEGDWAKTLDDARVMGHRYLVVASTPSERQRTLDDWRRVGEVFNRAGEQARRAGLTLAYHNHDVEFVRLEDRLPFDVLLESTDPRYLKIEMDLFWIRKGGQDPLGYFQRWPGRFPLVHVKDMTIDGRMVDVGAGAMDWRAIFAHRRQAGIQHFFVEHDEPADAMASVAASYRYLNGLRF
jgi:sugar phosphate isomerase/epimerase